MSLRIICPMAPGRMAWTGNSLLPPWLLARIATRTRAYALNGRRLTAAEMQWLCAPGSEDDVLHELAALQFGDQIFDGDIVLMRVA